jgi:hypothetical protein
LESNSITSSLDKEAAYKEAFVKGLLAGGKTLATKFNGSYVMDAVRKSHLQHLRAVADEPMTLHGMALKAMEENGAVGAKAIRNGVNKARILVGDVDTALGAMAVGKKGMTDPNHNSLRKTMFTFRKDNYKKVNFKAPNPADPNNPIRKHKLINQERASISAPLHTISGMVVPGLAMMKGQELLENYKNRGNATPAQGGYPSGERTTN